MPRDRWKPLRADEQVDAVLYEGPKASITFAKPAQSLCVDPEYVQARVLRIAIAGLPPFEAERLKSACAK